ncbi:MAG: acetylxylan esterase [Planctomycetes bacterium]|nr:acetylxylan esterase [Planctomycetota bacterium]
MEAARLFNAFVRQQAAELRAADKSPQTREEWAATKDALRSFLLQAWGGFPREACPLEPKILGELKREGYRVEKVVFQTFPGVWMTANAYVPNGEPGQKFPAVLCVHGHWPGAKQDPVVQSRCIGLARHGFFVLCVDAFGAGERAIDKKLGEYHGEMAGALLLPIGKPLSGLQVYENMRAIDYLQARTEVDAGRIGITGASGGGNQSLYTGGFDLRLRAVVPTCSVGTYQAYLTTACCMCEVVPGILRVTEEGNVLALSADRGLMVTSATQDAFQFSVDQARISLARATDVARLISPAGSPIVQHTIIEAPHHYNQPMREAMYGWMTRHLKGEGEGRPLPEPSLVTEDPETLRCWPGVSRPDDYVTLPRFAFAEARRLQQVRRTGSDPQRLARLTATKDATELNAWFKLERQALTASFGPQLSVSAPQSRETKFTADGLGMELKFEVEPGIEIVALCDSHLAGPEVKNRKIALLLDVDIGAEKTWTGDLAQEYRRQGYGIVAPELRATGRFAWPTDKIGQAPDHNSAEWSLLIGRPLLGQWALDIRRTLDVLAIHLGGESAEVVVVGRGASAVIAMTAAALDTRINRAVAIGGLATYASDRPYRGQRLGIMVPGLLRDVGDIGHIAALIAPRGLAIHGAVDGFGESLPLPALEEAFRYTRQVYSALGVADQFQILAVR